MTVHVPSNLHVMLGIDTVHVKEQPLAAARKEAAKAMLSMRHAGNYVAMLLDSAMSAGQQDKIVAYCDALNILDKAHSAACNKWLEYSR